MHIASAVKCTLALKLTAYICQPPHEPITVFLQDSSSSGANAKRLEGESTAAKKSIDKSIASKKKEVGRSSIFLPAALSRSHLNPSSQAGSRLKNWGAPPECTHCLAIADMHVFCGFQVLDMLLNYVASVPNPKVGASV